MNFLNNSNIQDIGEIKRPYEHDLRKFQVILKLESLHRRAQFSLVTNESGDGKQT